MKKPLTFFAIVSILLPLSACQQGRELSEMHDTTAEMRDITKDMRDYTKEMSVSTKAMGTDMPAMRESMTDVQKQMTQMNGLMRTMVDKISGMDQSMTGMSNNLGKMQGSIDQMHTDTQTLVSKMDHLSRVTEVNLGDTNKQMKGMAATTSQMLQTTNGLCQNRHSETAKNRAEAFRDLLASETPEEKVVQAGKYEMAFEFQQWAICGTDTVQFRSQLFKTAMTEFFFALKKNTTSTRFAAAMAPAHLTEDAGDSKDTNFNTIAVSLHMVDDVQQEYIPRYNAQHATKAPLVSLYSLILAGMKSPAGASTTSWQHEVLANRVAVERLLQARQNFALAVVVGKFTDKISRMSTTGASLFMNKVFGASTSWSANVDSFTIDELTKMNEYLGYCLKTRQDMKAIGLKPAMDFELAPFMNGMRLTSDNRGAQALVDARKRFMGMMNAARAL